MTPVSTATKHFGVLRSVSDLEGRESCCWLWTIANISCLFVVALVRPLMTVGPDANNSKIISSYRQPWLMDLCAGAPRVIVEQLQAGRVRTGTICLAQYPISETPEHHFGVRRLRYRLASATIWVCWKSGIFDDRSVIVAGTWHPQRHVECLSP